MAMNVVSKIDNRVKVNHALISVSDKTGLENLVPALKRINPDLRIFSTGGTYQRIQEILGAAADGCLTQVADYTGQPETQGGLVKTLDFRIYLGLLTETYNDAHQADLARTDSVAIDMVVVNLYPFKSTVARQDTTVENARGNIDIGGPCMIRAAAKNFIRVASVVDPADYGTIIDQLAAVTNWRAKPSHTPLNTTAPLRHTWPRRQRTRSIRATPPSGHRQRTRLDD
jgi:phosphoribosylaminoimidazolecarboxamide formyltransferase/IMP cyclohydrolase